jgi:hypothetical protein
LHKVPSSGQEKERIGLRAGTTGGMNEEKLEKADHVPGSSGHGDFTVSAC